jgi:hypothetical protein
MILTIIIKNFEVLVYHIYFLKIVFANDLFYVTLEIIVIFQKCKGLDYSLFIDKLVK